jgi:hypothetical protein
MNFSSCVKLILYEFQAYDPARGLGSSGMLNDTPEEQRSKLILTTLFAEMKKRK